MLQKKTPHPAYHHKITAQAVGVGMRGSSGQQRHHGPDTKAILLLVALHQDVEALGTRGKTWSLAGVKQCWM